MCKINHTNCDDLFQRVCRVFDTGNVHIIIFSEDKIKIVSIVVAYCSLESTFRYIFVLVRCKTLSCVSLCIWKYRILHNVLDV